MIQNSPILFTDHKQFAESLQEQVYQEKQLKQKQTQEHNQKDDEDTNAEAEVEEEAVAESGGKIRFRR